jgi:cytochrome c-type biogenesis protein CcmE
MTRKRRRLLFAGLGLLGLFAAAALVLTAFEDNLLFFHTPSDIAEGKVRADRAFRLGGLVEEGSVQRQEGSTRIAFAITDGNAEVAVSYNGILPDLFREGQGVVVVGRLDGTGHFAADEVLAKHDENYMPKEVADRLKEQGYWQGDEAQQGASGSQ